MTNYENLPKIWPNLGQLAPPIQSRHRHEGPHRLRLLGLRERAPPNRQNPQVARVSLGGGVPPSQNRTSILSHASWQFFPIPSGHEEKADEGLPPRSPCAHTQEF